MVSNAEGYLKNQMLDPKSFEKIESNLYPSYKAEELKSEIRYDSSTASMFLNLAEGHLELMKIWQGSYDSYGQQQFKHSKKNAQRYSDSCRFYLDRQNKNKEEYNKVVNTPQNTIIAYDVFIRYYAMSRGGQKKIGDGYVKLDVNGQPISHYTHEL